MVIASFVKGRRTMAFVATSTMLLFLRLGSSMAFQTSTTTSLVPVTKPTISSTTTSLDATMMSSRPLSSRLRERSRIRYGDYYDDNNNNNNNRRGYDYDDYPDRYYDDGYDSRRGYYGGGRRRGRRGFYDDMDDYDYYGPARRNNDYYYNGDYYGRDYYYYGGNRGEDYYSVWEPRSSYGRGWRSDSYGRNGRDWYDDRSFSGYDRRRHRPSYYDENNAWSPYGISSFEAWREYDEFARENRYHWYQNTPFSPRNKWYFTKSS